VFQRNETTERLVTDELDEFEESLVVVQVFRKISDCFRGIYGIKAK
jgi:hypothetical protein